MMLGRFAAGLAIGFAAWGDGLGTAIEHAQVGDPITDTIGRQRDGEARQGLNPEDGVFGKDTGRQERGHSPRALTLSGVCP